MNMNSISNAIENTKALAMDVMDKSLRFTFQDGSDYHEEQPQSFGGSDRRRRRSTAIMSHHYSSPSSNSSLSSSSSSTSYYYYHYNSHHNNLNNSPHQSTRPIVAPKRFRGAMEKLSLTEENLRLVLDQEGGLDKLKRSLRKRGAVTDSLCKQGLHLYVMEQNNKIKRSQTV